MTITRQRSAVTTGKDTMIARFQLILSLSLLMVCSWGQTEDKTKEAAARFKKGVALFNENNKEAAVAEFKTAYRLNPSWKIMYNIGQCEASLKRYGMAIEAFERYLAEGGDDVTVDRRDEVLKELDRLRKMVGIIKIKGPAGYDILIDKIKRGVTPMSSAILVTAGVEHRVEVVKDGHRIMDVAEKVSGGEVLELTARLPEPAPEPAPVPAVERPEQVRTAEVAESGSSTAVPAPPAPNHESSGEAAPPADAEAADPTPETAEPEAAGSDSAATTGGDDSRGWHPAVFFATAGATVLFGGVTGAMAVIIHKKWESSQDKFDEDPWSLNSRAVSDNVRSMQIVSWVALGMTGVAAVLTAVAAPMTDWGGDGDRAVGLRLTPYGGTAEGGLMISGRF